MYRYFKIINKAFQDAIDKLTMEYVMKLTVLGLCIGLLAFQLGYR